MWSWPFRLVIGGFVCFVGGFMAIMRGCSEETAEAMYATSGGGAGLLVVGLGLMVAGVILYKKFYEDD